MVSGFGHFTKSWVTFVFLGSEYCEAATDKTRKVAEVRLWLLLLGSWDKRWWSLTNQELPSLTQPIRIQYVLANEKVMNRHCWTTIWSPILASHHITEGLVTTFWNSGRVGGHVYTTDGCSCSWNVLSEKVGKFWLCQFKQLYTTDSRGCSWSVLSVLFTLTSGDSENTRKQQHKETRKQHESYNRLSAC